MLGDYYFYFSADEENLYKLLNSLEFTDVDSLNLGYLLRLPSGSYLGRSQKNFFLILQRGLDTNDVPLKLFYKDVLYMAKLLTDNQISCSLNLQRMLEN